MFSSPSSATVTMRTSDTASRSQSGLMQPTFGGLDDVMRGWGRINVLVLAVCVAVLGSQPP
jgi:hypothetical protein